MISTRSRYVGRDPCNTSGAPAPYFPNADCDNPNCDAERGAGGRNGNGRGRRKRDRERQSLTVTCGNRDCVIHFVLKQICYH